MTARRGLALLVMGLVALGWLTFSWGYIEDDGFIHLEYARSLLDGEGFAFDGRAVYADSSPLWVLALAALGAVGVPLVVAAKLLSIVALVVLLVGVARLGERLAGGAHARALGLASAALVLLNPFVLHWAFAGMEAVLGAAIAVWLALSVCRHAAGERARAGFVALAATAPLVRYELGLLVALAFIHYFVVRARAEGRRAAAPAFGLAVLAAVPLLVWSAYAALELGSLLPTTGPAKRIFGESHLANALKIAGTMATGFAAPLAAGAAVALRERLRRGAAARPGESVPWPLWLWPLGVLVFYAASGTAMQTRYALAPGILLTLVALAVCARAAAPRLALRAFLGGAALTALAIDAWMVWPCIANRVEVVALSRAFNALIRERVPADRPIAVYGIGQAAFELPHRIVDTGGLTMPALLAHRASSDSVRAWARSEGARCFIEGEPPPPGYELVASSPTPSVGWFLDRSRYAGVTPRNIWCERATFEKPAGIQ